MLTPTALTPLERSALHAIHTSRTRSLVRGRNGYTATLPAATPRAPDTTCHYTIRVLNRLERDGLVAFEPPQFPTRVTLTPEGAAIAAQIVAGDAAKAGAA